MQNKVTYTTDVTSARNRRVEKMYSATKLNFNNVKNVFTIDLRTVTHNIDKEESLQTSFGLLGSTYEKSNNSESTN